MTGKSRRGIFADNGWKSNLLVNIGYGDPGKLYGRLPRLSLMKPACWHKGVYDGVNGHSEFP